MHPHSSQSKKIEEYIDYIMNQQKYNNNSQQPRSKLTPQLIDRLQLLYPYLTPQDLMKKLSSIHENNSASSKELENLCYLGLGRQLVRSQKIEQNYEVSRVNLHIRNYMIPNVEQHVTQLLLLNPDKVYITTCSRGLAFDPLIVPQPLKTTIQQSEYHQIIREINHIIQKKICQYKNKIVQPDNISKIIMLLIISIIIILISYFYIQVETTVIFYGLTKALALITILVYAIHTFRAERKQYPVIDAICHQLKKFLDFVNAKGKNNLHWKIGLDFFWIEISITKQENDNIQRRSTVSYNNTSVVKEIKKEALEELVGFSLMRKRNTRAT